MRREASRLGEALAAQSVLLNAEGTEDQRHTIYQMDLFSDGRWVGFLVLFSYVHWLSITGPEV